MPEEMILETSKIAVDRAFNCKQAAYEKYNYARIQTNLAYKEMQENWDKFLDAKGKMEEEYNVVYDSPNSEVWEEFADFKRKTHAQIEQLRREIESEKHKMDRCFNQAKSAFDYGKKGDAPEYAQRAHDHKERISVLNTEIKQKCQAIRFARSKAEEKAPRKNNEEFEAARSAYEEAKERHELSRMKFLHFKKERDDYKKKFDDAKTLYNCAKNSYLDKADSVNLENEEEKKEEAFMEEPSSNETEEKDGFLRKVFSGLFG